jgi:transaldolase
MPKLSDLEVKLSTDGADKAQILDMAKQPWIRGFTTNPWNVLPWLSVS